MRQFIDIVERAEEEIEEASVSRIVQHIRNGTPFVMISAMRAYLDKKENARRTRRLRHILNGLPVSYIDTEGEYWEIGADNPSRELSFFIMPSSKREREMPIDLLQRIGEKLMNTFDQDTIIFGNGETVTLIDEDGKRTKLGDNTTFDPAKIADEPGFSKIKGRKFSFTDKPTRLTYGETPRQIAF